MTGGVDLAISLTLGGLAVAYYPLQPMDYMFVLLDSLAPGRVP